MNFTKSRTRERRRSRMGGTGISAPPTSDPDYAGLTGVVFHTRAEGFEVGVTNSFGVVDGSGNVTKAKSVLTTVHEFDSIGTAPTLVGSGTNKRLVFGGAGRLRHNGGLAVFNEFHHNATLNNMKTIIHGVIKIGNTNSPGVGYGIVGDNAGSTNNKGMAITFDDTVVNGRRNYIQYMITKAVNSVFITRAYNNCIFPANTWMDFWWELDKAKDREQEVKCILNNNDHTIANDVDNNTTVTTPTFAMEIGGMGNGVAPAIMELKEITFQTGVVTEAFRTEFIQNRMTKYGISVPPSSVDSIPMIRKYEALYTLNETRYYLPVVVCQNPTNPDVIVVLFHDSLSHTDDPNGRVSKIKSINRGASFGAKTTVYDPVGPLRPMGVSAGYDSAGKLHMMIDLHTSYDALSTNTLQYWNSIDDGDNWNSTDITATLAGDGLNGWRVTDRIVQNNNVLFAYVVKVTDEVTITESANYVLRTTDFGANWTLITIRAKGAAYYNEGSFEGLGPNHLLCLIRDEILHEWQQTISPDNGLNWPALGPCTFGEVLTRESPPSLTRTSDFIACTYANRDRDQLVIIYARPADLIANGVAGWNIRTRHVLFQGINDEHLHYGNLIFPNNDFNSYGVFARDPYPSTGLGTANVMVGFKGNTIQYSDVKALLGL